MTTLVSVVIPTYYRNDALDRALQSVTAQTHDPVEVIVVDGSGEAHARPVAERHDVRYVEQERDEGAQAARGEGARLASGEFINFLDDDDEFHPEKLERQLAVHTENPDVGVVYCAVTWSNGHVVRPDPEVQGQVLEAALRFRMTPSSPSTMLIDAGVLTDMLPLTHTHGADDMGMKIDLAQRTAFAFVDDPLVRKGQSDDSLGGSRANVEGRFYLLDHYADLYDQYPPEVRRDALAHTHLLDADQRLHDRLWSWQAIVSAARACYYVPGLPISFAGYFLATLFGRPGRDVGRAIYEGLLLGDEHRGKIT